MLFKKSLTTIHVYCYWICFIALHSVSGGKVCEDPGEVANSTRIPDIRKRGFNKGERVIYECVTGYQYPKTGHEVVCLPNGAWDPPLPQCIHLQFPPTKTPLVSNEPKVANPPTKPPKRNSTNTIVIATSVISLCVIILSVVSFLLWRKWHQYGIYTWTRRHSSVVVENNYHLPLLEPAKLRGGSVPADEFAQYVAVRHNSNDQKFMEEFEEIQTSCEMSHLTYEASMMTENKLKNRYTNIVAYDHSRVHLCSSSNYINANYVSSYSKPKAYIACQGPLPTTFNDFWKMVWDNNTATIVMITNLVEKGRRKCDQYWPHEGREQYKHISVTLKATETFANFTVRRFSVKNTTRNRRNAERRIVQFHFTQWPDHGAPEYLLPVLTFVHRSSSANPSLAGPIAIHCSAGVGRTGTYIVIHSMMQMLQATGHINVKDFLLYIRKERNHLVQTEDQYVFVHEALLEYIRSGITECSLLQLAGYYKALTSHARSDQNSCEQGDAGNVKLRSGLESQFMKIVYSPTDYLDYDFATRAVNAVKNRPSAVLPVFRSRVPLCNSTSVEGSDYINASFIQGYRSSHEFLITQLPLASTKKDFWQLIWDHNCPTIVTVIGDEWSTESDVYWPTNDMPLHFSSFNVSSGSETSSSVTNSCGSAVITRDFILEATKDDYVLEVKQFQICSWDKEEPSLTQLQAVRSVVDFTKSKEGSTVIQDRHGSTAAAQFACWHLMQCQLDNENTVDVYQTAMIACQMRPRVFTSPSHLRFLYKAVLLEANVRSTNRTVAMNGTNDSPGGYTCNNEGSTSTNESPSCHSDDITDTACLVARPHQV